uniref:lymphokine-activated killer T-cell-originated protein kinase isoform X2 n=1 Tax=Nyctereutes procyonoides TaxID=34880 RepID=UPI002443E82A|nr:lymphokine-activated killer T-cell-originated protein kinase isoform X2 [Nyctereutes procyonoides]
MEEINNFKTPSKLSEKKKSALCSTPCINIPASPFMQKLGFGTGVNVYLMKRSPRGLSHSPWAVKKINPKCNDHYQSMYQKRLIDEAKILKNLHHPNIYLHQEKKLLHGDIKSSNVVIKGDFETIKICDVGVSLPLDENMTVTDPEACYIGTEPWKPKEALEENGIITDKADIFAFGLTLWEMMTLSIPHINLPDDDDDEDRTFDESDFDDEAYYAALGTRPPVNMEELDETYQKVIELFSVCTNEDPKDRPSAAHIVEALEIDVQ